MSSLTVYNINSENASAAQVSINLNAGNAVRQHEDPATATQGAVSLNEQGVFNQGLEDPIQTGSRENSGEQVLLGEVQTPTQQRQNSIPEISHQLDLETSLYLLRCIALFGINITLAGVIILIIYYEQSFWLLQYAFISYLIIFFVESIARTLIKNRKKADIKEDIFNAIDCVCGLVLIACLNFADTEKSLMITTTLIVTNLVLYVIISDVDLTTKIKGILTRIFYSLQSAILVAKLCGNADWDWDFVISPIFAYFAVYVPFYLAFLVILILVVLFEMLKKVALTQALLDTETQILGLFWSCTFSSLSCTMLYMLYGISPAAKGDFNIIYQASISLLVTSFLLAILSIKKQSRLVFFLQNFNASADNEESNMNPPNFEGPRLEIKLNPHKARSLFMMLSPTYFMPLKNALLSSTFNNLRKASMDEQVKRSVPKSAKIKLNNKISEMLPRKKFEDVCLKRCATEQDIDDLEACHAVSCDEDQDLCYICFQAKANAILMTCGHGGVCYGCAARLVQDKGECMECRGQVEAIIKISTKAKMFEVIQGVEISSVTRTIKN